MPSVQVSGETLKLLKMPQGLVAAAVGKQAFQEKHAKWLLRSVLLVVRYRESGVRVRTSRATQNSGNARGPIRAAFVLVPGLY